MAKNEFSLKRFAHIGHLSSILAGVAIGLLGGPAANLEVTLLRGLAGGLIGLLVSGCFYLFLVGKDQAKLTIPPEELNGSEVILLESPVGHYQRFCVGGKLFLTDQALEFRAHRGQPGLHQLTIPLCEIACAEPCKICSLFPGGLRVEKTGGTTELFSFGVFGDSQPWAAAINTVARIGESQ